MTAIHRFFEDDAADYDRWFDDHAEVCHTPNYGCSQGQSTHGFKS